MDRTRVKTVRFISSNRQYFMFNIYWRDCIKKEGVRIITGWEIVSETAWRWWYVRRLFFTNRREVIVENIRNLKGISCYVVKALKGRNSPRFFLFSVNKAIFAIPGVLHVIQIVSKECVIIILFTQPSKGGNFISLAFILCEIPWLKKRIFHFDRFFWGRWLSTA